MARWPIPAPTAAAQRRASSPGRSAWVHANAGSGKTHVLAQRVVRLLLQGSDPSKILCLTFTKAAAANMSLRIFSILSRWTRLEDAQLLAELRAFGMRFDAKPAVARRLFARAVETPGGLKIQTIHAFCERILHLFPFEANVPASFEAVNDEQQALLMEQARQDMLQTAAAQPSSRLGEALTYVASETTTFSFEALLREALGKRSAIVKASQLQGDGFERALSVRMGLKLSETEEVISNAILQEGFSEEKWCKIVEILDSSGANDKKLANCYRLANSSPTTEGRLAAYKKLFYDSKGLPKNPKSGWLVNKAVGSEVNEALLAERDRIVPLYDKLKASQTVKRSVALQQLNDAVLGNYLRLKQAQGLLDFDDLIERTSTLLTRSDAAWILYKLDAGIDHILLDEAQDTSPAQWEILRRLVDDFWDGTSARPNERTLFAVGDEKQSIFSFQGAAPGEFIASAKYFARKIADAQQRFRDVKLHVSFRSSQTILKCVDDVFSHPEHFAGLSIGDEVQTVHEAWKHDVPGLVEIWDPCTGEKKEEPEDWRMPVDTVPESAPVAVLAGRIAQKIKGLLAPENREAVYDNNGVKRPVRPGDIMILVRRRNAFFDAVIKALKVADVPVAGADRLKLMDHIAVMDLVAAGRAALLPQDDLTLACVLKSPLFDHDDDDLIRLAPHRKGSLFSELLRSNEPKDKEAAGCILEWGKDARSLGPYRFYAKILGAGGGRKRILKRLGTEAGDAIDEFMRLALDRERMQAASLTGFLQSMQSAEIEVKRDMEAAGDFVRVMTVHAAKGLEAKIVFLPDTIAKPSGQHDPKLIELDLPNVGNVPVWRRRTKDDPEAVNAEVSRLRADEESEYRRLLYVAMTRAEERLYVSGYHGEKEPQNGCWYRMIRSSLETFAEEVDAPWSASAGPAKVLRIGATSLLDAPTEQEAPKQGESAPSWLFVVAPPEAAPTPPLRPSRALAAADQIDVQAGSGSRRRLAMLEGRLAHALLQHLPDIDPAQRADAAGRFLTARGSEIDEIRRGALVRDVLALMDDAQLAPLFGPKARAEAAIAGRIPLAGGAHIEITGRIDRLAETEDAVLIADFKTGAPSQGGKIPSQYLVQMALYRASLQPLFPGKLVRAMLIWTERPVALELATADLDAALARVTAQDGGSYTSS